MSLTTILVAFALVAVVFIAAALGTGRRPDRSRAHLADVWRGATLEALVLTLVAALWFGSLGHGGWWILFPLLGALPAGDRWVRRRLAGAPAAGETGQFVASLLKYLLAGLVCAWRLS